MSFPAKEMSGSEDGSHIFEVINRNPDVFYVVKFEIAVCKYVYCLFLF